MAAHGFLAATLDLRGHGDSDWARDADYTLDALADDVRRAAATLPGPPVLVGASLGGLAALVAEGEGAGTAAALDRLLDEVGLAGTVRIGEDAVEVDLHEAPATVELAIRAEAGAVIVSAAGALEPFLRLRFDIPGVAVQQIDTTAGSLHVEATASGQPRDLACTAADVIDNRIDQPSLIATVLPGP